MNGTEPHSRSVPVVLASIVAVAAFGAGVLVGAYAVDDDTSADTPRAIGDGDDPSGDAADETVEATPGTASPTVGSPFSCPLFPQNSYWYADISELPVHPDSDTYIDAIGRDAGLHPDFGTVYEGEPIGIPYTVTGGDTAEVEVDFEYDDESDPGPYPITRDALIEGGPDSDGDRHVLVVDDDNCMLYELFYAFPEGEGAWSAVSGAVFDLTSNELRPDEFTSADAAGLPILPALVRYDEVASGEIYHALRFTAEATQDIYWWPARHQAGDADQSLPPMGAWLRLRDDVDLSEFSPDVQVILEALQRHGMILADNGSAMFVSGVPDERWDDEVLAEMGALTTSSFEVIDASSLMVDPDSGEAG